MTTLDARATPSTMSRPSRMQAHAALSVGLRPGAGGQLGSCVTALRSEAPMMLRPTIGTGREPLVEQLEDVVRVSVAASSAGPVGGDQLRLDVRVEAGSTLVLTQISATLLLPGRDGAQSSTEVHVRVEDGGTLVWLPEPVIAARGCHHLNTVRVALATTARLVMREELILGRHGEQPGLLEQRTRVERADRALYVQDLVVGNTTSTSPVVAGSHRAMGSLLIIDPAWDPQAPASSALPGHAALMPLPGPGVLLTAVGVDNLEVRRQLSAGLHALGPPWSP